MSLITVITPTFNREAYLKGAIESVLGQRYQNFEHLIIDDGSTDQTSKLIRSIKDPRVKYHYQSNAGQVKALNSGLKLAKGNTVAFLDSDDEFLPEHLSTLHTLLNSKKGFDFVLGKFKLILTDKKIKPVVRDFYKPEKTIAVSKIECITGVLFGKRNAFLEVGSFRNVKSADTDMFVRLQEADFKWVKATKATYAYYFGRTPHSQAIIELGK